MPSLHDKDHLVKLRESRMCLVVCVIRLNRILIWGLSMGLQVKERVHFTRTGTYQWCFENREPTQQDYECVIRSNRIMIWGPSMNLWRWQDKNRRWMCPACMSNWDIMEVEDVPSHWNKKRPKTPGLCYKVKENYDSRPFKCWSMNRMCPVTRSKRKLPY